MKERIKEKLEENIERILSKEELTKADVDILQLKLCEIENEENASKKKKKNEELKDLFSKVMDLGN